MSEDSIFSQSLKTLYCVSTYVKSLHTAVSNVLSQSSSCSSTTGARKAWRFTPIRDVNRVWAEFSLEALEVYTHIDQGDSTPWFHRGLLRLNCGWSRPLPRPLGGSEEANETTSLEALISLSIQ